MGGKTYYENKNNPNKSYYGVTNWYHIDYADRLNALQMSAYTFNGEHTPETQHPAAGVKGRAGIYAGPNTTGAHENVADYDTYIIDEVDEEVKKNTVGHYLTQEVLEGRNFGGW